MHAYSDSIAAHYQAFRPALHEDIIREALTHSDFANGLDVGCGTSESTKALLKFCERVTGIDPSREMLGRASALQNATFMWFDGYRFPFERRLFDIVTFAGSLFYMDKKNTLTELERVMRDKGTVLVYDFNILLNDVIQDLGLPAIPVNYDHSVNLDAFQGNHLHKMDQQYSERTFDISLENLAHLLLADADMYSKLIILFGQEDIFSKLVESLSGRYGHLPYEVMAKTYFTLYQFSK